jgi:hypothetical protein
MTSAAEATAFVAPRRHPHNQIEVGAFLLFLSIYTLTGPGRIDMIDGQYRFEVSWNMVDLGRPIVRDAFLQARTGVDGARYSYYGPAASVAGAPLVAIGYVFGDEDGELARFLFSFTSAIFSAAILSLLLHWWLRMGFSARKALSWTVVVGLATLLWPLATSTFDQAQHAFFVLASAYAGRRSADGGMPKRWAMLCGSFAGILLLYQFAYVVVAPWLALSLVGQWRPFQFRPALSRLAYFAIAFLTCAALLCIYNVARFGSPFDIGGFSGLPGLGNPLVGVAGLTVSPGKGILWYSPVILLQLWSIRLLARARHALATTVVATSLADFLLISSLSFYGGDWCWGPRYFVTTLPLLALGLPYLRLGTPVRRWMARAIVSAGLLVQIAGLSMDHQGFFFARALRPHFWTDAAFNFRHSQLVARLGELRGLLAGVRPAKVVPFRPGPYASLSTYCIFGTDPPIAPVWMKAYPVFYLPRPWPLWMPSLPADSRPAPVAPTAGVLLLVGALGIVRLRRGILEKHASGADGLTPTEHGPAVER